MGWNPIEQPVDYIVLGGSPSPGIADVVGAGSRRDWDKKKGRGTSGARATFTGKDLSQFSVQLFLYTAADWAAWDVWKPLVLRVPTSDKDAALAIQHPHLEELEIRAVVVEEVLAPQQVEDGVWMAEVRFLEWREPKAALATPKSAKGSPAKKPVDPVEQEIDALTDQWKELAAQ